MKLKEFRLDFEALLSDVVYGHGYLHYGYWPEGRPDTPSVQALGAAQQTCFDRVAAEIPASGESILDIGSGTGANALAPGRLGCKLECLSPSQQINAVARARLPATVRVHDVCFEELDLPRRFDLCLFAESFHYVRQGAALAETDRHAREGAIIFDYFRRPGTADIGAAAGRRQTHPAFLDALVQYPHRGIAHDEDVTQAILPTFFVLDHIKNNHLAPFLSRFRAEFRRARPVRGRLAEWGLGRRLDRFLRPSRREETFAQQYEYRLIRLQRVA